MLVINIKDKAMMKKAAINPDHSSAWIFQTWISFIISISATSIGIIYLPVDAWTKGFMGMGLAFSIGSTISLTKTQRDLHEATKLTSKIEEARVEKILTEHDNFKS
ncbi:MAG: YiaA/YiaB family inner membrane protein [Xenococcaceae cyanobacterium MO_167.B52]|nr:YiaA/YiaB family inner membrane protein [Xenococcaceae cyanobacterium MO_167.B52]